MLKLGVLVSGSGSNLQAIIDRIKEGSLNAVVEVVISDNEHAYALKRAKQNGILVYVVNYKSYAGRDQAEDQLIMILKKHNIELVVLAGYMKLLTKRMMNAFPMRIMNIHPAILPSFPGVNAVKQAMDYGVKFTGCTVHFVDEGTDTGPIIIQAVVSVRDDDTEETLAQRIHRKEHIIYPIAIQLFAQDRLLVKGRRVFIKDYKSPQQSI